jgi:predicted nucleic acid-binding protein
MLTTNLVLAEIHRLFLHRAGTKAAAAALEKIEASPLVRTIFADSMHHSSAKDWMKKLQDYPISYTDAISFSVMKMTGCAKAMSFDKHFRVAGFDVLV